MPHTITKEIEIRETIYHQEPEVMEGDRYIDDSGRYCEVNHVRFIKYVWEDVSQWEITITVYDRNELTESEVLQWEKQREAELLRIKEEKEEKQRKWIKEHKLRRIDIGVGGSFIVEVYEYSGRILLRGCDSENNNASKVVVPSYVDRLCEDAFQDNESITELVFLNEKCELTGGWSSRIGGGWFNNWPNLEKIVLPGQAKFERDCVCFYGCDKLESIEFNGDPESSMYYAVFLPEAIVVYKKAKYFKMEGDIHAIDDVAIGVSPKNVDTFEMPPNVGSISNHSLNFIFAYYRRLQSLVFMHNLNIYCVEFKEYDDASVFSSYTRGPKEIEVILRKDVQITLAHPTIILNEKLKNEILTGTHDFSSKHDYKLGTKAFRLIADDNDMPVFQYGNRHFRGWGEDSGSEGEINDIRNLFAKNVRLIYR